MVELLIYQRVQVESTDHRIYKPQTFTLWWTNIAIENGHL